MLKHGLRGLMIAALMLCLTLTAALAETALPHDITEYFSNPERISESITSAVEIEGKTFVATKDDQGTNFLYGFRRSDGEWNFWLKTSSAVPQGEGTLVLSNAQGSSRLLDDKRYSLPTLSIGRLEPDYGEYVDMSVRYELRNGTWYLEDMCSNVGDGYWVLFHNDTLTYYDEYEAFRAKGSITATVQRDLRYVSLDTIPKSYANARAKLTTAPTLPESSELTAQEIKFTGGKRYNVYSAPDSMSLRSANGKAAVSTNSWIQVFGREDSWILIQYSIDADHYRFGYISSSALPANAEVPVLNFSDKTAYLNQDFSVTDDPFYSCAGLVTLPEGSPVTLLATLGGWAYIESSTGDTFRGFIPRYMLNTAQVFNMNSFPTEADSSVTAFTGEVQVEHGYSFYVNVSVSAFGPLAKSQPATLLISDTQSGEVLLTLTATGNAFSGASPIPSATTSLTLTPFDINGQYLPQGITVLSW